MLSSSILFYTLLGGHNWCILPYGQHTCSIVCFPFSWQRNSTIIAVGRKDRQSKKMTVFFFECHRQWKEHHSCICIIYSVCAYICTQCGQMLVFTCTICKSRLFYIPMIDVDIHKWPTYIIYIKQDLLYPDDESAQLPDPAERLEELQTR